MATRAVANLLRLSESGELSEAIREWSCDPRAIRRDDAEYTGKCQLCGQTGTTGLKCMARITNNVNGTTILVGLDCACRFSRNGGATTEEENREIIMRQMDEEKRRQEQRINLPILQRHLPELLNPSVSWSLQQQFCRLATAWLGPRFEHIHDNERVSAFLHELLGRPAEADESMILRAHLLGQARVVLADNLRSTHKSDEAVDGHWAGTIRSRKQVHTTLAPSAEYQNPADLATDRQEHTST